MNELFVKVKVDREERPDVDELYMQAVQAMTGQGGWPMTVFLDPEGVPFYGGTYFPPSRARDAELSPGAGGDRRGLPQPARADRAALETGSASSRQRSDGLAGSTTLSIPPCTAGQRPSGAADMPRRLRRGAEVPAGKRTRIPPRARGARARPRTPRREDGVGGIYDQVGGGFHRYSVDATWLVPHFEKMLYDNALLARAYLHGYQAIGEERWKRVCPETLEWALGRCAAPRAASTRRSTPTRRARRAATTSGRRRGAGRPRRGRDASRGDRRGCSASASPPATSTAATSSTSRCAPRPSRPQGSTRPGGSLMARREQRAPRTRRQAAVPPGTR